MIYFLAEFFLWWAIPLTWILFETTNHYRRSGKRGATILFSLIMISLVTLIVLYFVFNGFENLRPAMQRFERDYLE